MQYQYSYSIGGLNVGISGGKTALLAASLQGMAPFAVPTAPHDISIEFDHVATMPQLAVNYRFGYGADDDRMCTVGRSAEGDLWYIFEDEGWLMQRAGDERTVRCGTVSDGALLRFILWTAYGLMASHRGRVPMHSSAVVHDNKAVLCLGESGTGKSTHTRLWTENIHGAWLLNDDSPIVSVADGEVVAYGSPWSGKTPCFRTEKCTIAAFVRIKQHSENIAHRLGNIEAFGALQPSCPPPLSHDDELLDTLVNNLSAMIGNVPVFRLECRPDADAVRVCRDAVMPPTHRAMMLADHHVMNHRSRSYTEYFRIVAEELNEGKRVTISLGGKSMFPTLTESDKVLIEQANNRPLQAGDVALFRHNGLYVMHRVVATTADGYIFQGDNCYGTETVSRADVMGRLVEVVRESGERISVNSAEWQQLSRRSLRRKRTINFLRRWLSAEGRRKLRPWYFGVLLFLMWAPLNGVGLKIDNFVFGLRVDHILHASVYIPCAIFITDLVRKRLLAAWLVSVLIGLITELVQYLLPYRGFDITDIAANTFGVTFGIIAIFFVRRMKKKL